MPHTCQRFTFVDALEDHQDDLARAVLEGLSDSPRHLPCRFLYDEAGGRLFEEICELEEYYPTRAEHEILVARSAELADRFRGSTVVELGSGSSEKTEVLLSAMCAQASPSVPTLYVPVDINATALREAGARLTAAHSELEVLAIAGEYGRGMEVLTRRVEGHKLVLFLGGNIGNFDRARAAGFLRGLLADLGPGDAFLMGVDLRKDRATLELAYDDPAGITARFNLNLLTRINRELGGQFDLARFQHEARYDEVEGVVHLHLVSLARQEVRIEALGRSFLFEEGERIHTEDSTKYSRAEIEELATDCGLHVVEHFVDELGRYSLNLFERAKHTG